MSQTRFYVPEPTLRRLPWYLAYAQLVQHSGETFLSSTQIAKNIAVDASKVAKDLSYVQISGRTRVGYDVNELVEVLEKFLGFTKSHKAFLFGVGSLGGALMHDNGLNAELSIGYKVMQRDVKNKNIINEYKLMEYSFLSSWGANELSTVQGIKSIKSTYGILELIEKSYNLDYSDNRLRQIETLLKSLSNEPSEADTLNEKPIILDSLKSLTQSLNLK